MTGDAFVTIASSRAPGGELRAAITGVQIRTISAAYRAGEAPARLIACIRCSAVCWGRESELRCDCCGDYLARKLNSRGQSRALASHVGEHCSAPLVDAMRSIPKTRAA
jgi:hypothetical protein